jgi:extradiol dioxygenase family protein
MAHDRAEDAFPRWPNWPRLVVEDLDAARRFYGDVLGLPEMDAGDDWVQFDLGKGRLFELLRRDDQIQYDRVRFQPGFAVGDIGLARERLIGP